MTVLRVRPKPLPALPTRCLTCIHPVKLPERRRNHPHRCPSEESWAERLAMGLPDSRNWGLGTAQGLSCMSLQKAGVPSLRRGSWASSLMGSSPDRGFTRGSQVSEGACWVLGTGTVQGQVPGRCFPELGPVSTCAGTFWSICNICRLLSTQTCKSEWGTPGTPHRPPRERGCA